ncbi:MAG TPA: hypothetical protein DEG23_03165 [Coxiellaceae bacterium]|nr:hypothetical protein [Coxiellaceae bacterium]
MNYYNHTHRTKKITIFAAAVCVLLTGTTVVAMGPDEYKEKVPNPTSEIHSKKEAIIKYICENLPDVSVEMSGIELIAIKAETLTTEELEARIEAIKKHASTLILGGVTGYSEPPIEIKVSFDDAIVLTTALSLNPGEIENRAAAIAEHIHPLFSNAAKMCQSKIINMALLLDSEEIKNRAKVLTDEIFPLISDNTREAGTHFAQYLAMHGSSIILSNFSNTQKIKEMSQIIKENAPKFFLDGFTAEDKAIIIMSGVFAHCRMHTENLRTLIQCIQENVYPLFPYDIGTYDAIKSSIITDFFYRYSQNPEEIRRRASAIGNNLSTILPKDLNQKSFESQRTRCIMKAFEFSAEEIEHGLANYPTEANQGHSTSSSTSKASSVRLTPTKSVTPQPHLPDLDWDRPPIPSSKTSSVQSTPTKSLAPPPYPPKLDWLE